MLSISVEEFLIWKKNLLSKGGDQQSFAFLLDCIGGISTSDLNLKSINPRGKLLLKKNLEFLESVWDDHLQKSCPIQYLCGITFWRDLKLKVTNKVLIPRPETELIVCLLYTSDAADERSSVDLGGRRIIKKKLRIFRICLGRSFVKILPNSIPLWNNFLEKLKIKSYKQSPHT